jgi:SAM-dependent methyltransferase
MTRLSAPRLYFLACAVLGCVALVQVFLGESNAQAPASRQGDYEPRLGEAGKDVVWVPMPEDAVDKLLDMAKVTKDDYVIDLGSGDGRTVIAAAKRGARAYGVEFNPKLVEYSKRLAIKEGVSDRARFEVGDLFAADLSQATVITLFLLQHMNLKLRPDLLKLKPGTRIVANTFNMGDWPADQTEYYPPGCYQWCNLYLWIVPANVDGTWRAPQGEVTIRQQFQSISGTLGTGPTAVALTGRIEAERVRFTAGGSRYSVALRGNELVGTVETGTGLRPWNATR